MKFKRGSLKPLPSIGMKILYKEKVYIVQEQTSLLYVTMKRNQSDWWLCYSDLEEDGWLIDCELLEEQITREERCPLCGYIGENMAVKFYCTNKECRNYKL